VEKLAQLSQQGCVFRKPFHQDLARPVEYRLCIPETRIGIQVFQRGAFRRQIGVCEQRLGQRRKPRLAGNLRDRKSVV
jgi:hypothetical protein